jgi:hypothetical protein
LADDRLDSVHLQSTRREQFRAAREVVLGACGPATLAGSPGPAALAPSPTAVQHRGHTAAASASPYFLMDRDYIYPLRTGLNTVGRLPDNDVVIMDPYVSRRHCVILVHAHNGCELHDVASKNGTLINGRPLSGPTRLNPGDRILMCERQMVFQSREGLVEAPDWPTTCME